MMKKIILAFTALVLICTALASCSGESTDDPEITPAATEAPAVEETSAEETEAEEIFEYDPEEWYADLYNHWHFNESGQRVDLSPHESERKCTVCNAYFFLDAMGNTNIILYNKQGDMKVDLLYDQRGNLIDGIYALFKYEEYNGSTVKLSEKNYDPYDNLVGEYYYKTVEGASFLNRMVSYLNGMTFITEYDKFNNIVLEEMIDASGVSSGIFEYEYTYDSEGFKLNDKVKKDGKPYSEGEYAIDKSGKRPKNYTEKRTFFLENGGTEVCTYQEDLGLMLTKSVYSPAGKLVCDQAYGIKANGWETYVKTETLYNANGTKTVTEYDENGNIISKE